MKNYRKRQAYNIKRESNTVFEIKTANKNLFESNITTEILLMIRKIIVNLSLNKVGFELMCYICMYFFFK